MANYTTYREYLTSKIYEMSKDDINFFMFMETYLNVIQDNVFPDQLHRIRKIMTEYFESNLKDGRFEVSST